MRIIGHVDDVTLFHVVGWAADLDDLAAALPVALYLEGVEVARTSADRPRGGLEGIAPGATGRYAFTLAFPTPLSPFRAYDIAVRIVPDGISLPPGTIRRDAIAHDGAPPPPPRPILVSTMGAAEASVLMGVLAAQPGIVVTKGQPGGVALLRYYSAALRTLCAAGEHEVAPPDGAARFDLGWNPTLAPGFRLLFGDQSLFTGHVTTDLPRRLAAAFRDVIGDFFRVVARDQGQPAPDFFAEAAPVDELTRGGARYLFGAVKEIVLLRDPRDALSGHSGDDDTPEAAFAALAEAADRMVAIHGRAADDVLFVRIEDFLSDPDATLARLGGFLGRDVSDPATVWTENAAAAEARAYLAGAAGRWRRTFDAAMLARCARFDAFLRLFGYASGPAPAVHRGAVDAAALQRYRDLMMRFESLGENCEFGLAQRRCGAEPLGLLRFSSSPLPKLLRALEARFEGLGTADNLEVQLPRNAQEYMILDRRYGFYTHAWVKVGDMSPEAVHAREVKRVPFLVRKLIGDLMEGEKIFVFHGMAALAEAEARDLWRAMRRYGPATLLWVEVAPEARMIGTVERIDDGLYKGYMDRFAPGEDAHDLSLEVWIDICVKQIEAMNIAREHQQLSQFGAH